MNYIINELVFTSKKKAENLLKEIKFRGELDSLFNDEEFNYGLSYFKLFKKDRDFSDVIAIRRVIEPKNKIIGQRGLRIVKKDGTEEIISHKCTKHSDLIKFKTACRDAISNEIITFKNNFWNNNEIAICPFEKITITKNTSHVDHYNLDFNDVVMNFIKTYNIKDFKSCIEDLECGYRLIKYKNEFIEYHNNNTNLRIISIKANLSTRKKL